MLIAAVDIGTSSTRALLFEDTRATGVACAVEYPLRMPEPGAAELDPPQVMDALVACLRDAVRIAGRAPDAIVLSCAMHSLLAVAEDGTPLTPACTWADNRAAPQAAELLGRSDARSLYATTGVPLHPMSPLPKLRWLARQRPDEFARAAHFASLKEWVCHQWFGRWVVDDSIASASGLYSLAARDWSDAAVTAAGVTRDRLSEVARAHTVLRGMARGYADAIGVPADIPVVLGAADGCLANLGAGVLSGNGLRRAVLTIGTSGAFRLTVDRPATDERMRTFCYALTPGQFVIGGATNGGGLPLRWLRDNFPQLRIGLPDDARDPYAVLADIAAGVAPGADGLLFHPYLAGERAPLWNADARASFIGLTFAHGPAHMVRAVMEGVLFNLAMILDVLEDLAGGPVADIVAGGGFARSDLWLSMAADIFDRPILVAENPETTAQGAALLALAALVPGASLETLAAGLPAPSRSVKPVAATRERYRELRGIFADIPDKLAPSYAALAAFQRQPARR